VCNNAGNHAASTRSSIVCTHHPTPCTHKLLRLYTYTAVRTSRHINIVCTSQQVKQGFPIRFLPTSHTPLNWPQPHSPRFCACCTSFPTKAHMPSAPCSYVGIPMQPSRNSSEIVLYSVGTRQEFTVQRHVLALLPVLVPLRHTLS
jgi:hypothetical protein